MSNSLPPHGVQHVGLSCPSLTPGACSNSCPLIESVMPSNHLILCHPILLLPSISPSNRTGSFPMSQFFASSDQRIRASASASILPMNIQGLISFRIDWFVLLEVQATLKSLSKTTVQKHQFFGTPALMLTLTNSLSLNNFCSSRVKYHPPF